ncbi:MFS transporter [Histidinibacterium aquaticum]|uniref:MFS transporter n=1 Tax=Histidinibacterium aquaticum TaxID=2613962 RepID=A0A5J5GQ96_9RHOB|nr:MFS transporter [Histidinibacterium aquaticum]KAA9010245.1 MFS transporter [Histidinibacterium aquaticum]
MTALADTPASLAPARLATRLAFFAAGFAVSCWAPLIPFAKDQTGVSEAGLGLLLLCLGIGSVIAMPVTGWLSAKRGARPMMLVSGFGLAAVLPLLILTSEPMILGALLFVFGAALGTLDVSMNVHGAEVERRDGRPLMSGFHAQFSIGGLVGAGGVTALLAAGLSPQGAALTGSALTLAAMLGAAPRLLRARSGEAPTFALPRGVVLLLAVLAAICFLVEGAVLDWGALLLVERDLSAPERAGLGYVVFSVTMTIGRLTGDRIVSTVGGKRVLIWGGILTMAGLALTASAPAGWIALAGFALIGAGASNIVPVIFSHAGRQTVMDPGLAIAAVTTTGYAGVLLGPAGIGVIAEWGSLPAAYWMLVVLMALIPLSAARATRG